MIEENQDERVNAAINGAEIGRIMSNPGYEAAMNAVRAEIVNGWSAAQTVDDRERAWYTLRALEHFEAGLRAYAANGIFDRDKLLGRI